MSIVILKNELPESAEKWEEACKRKQLSYSVVDLTNYDWYEQIIHQNPSILLLKPSGLTAPFKELYDERLKILVDECGMKCYPSLKSN